MRAHAHLGQALHGPLYTLIIALVATVVRSLLTRITTISVTFSVIGLIGSYGSSPTDETTFARLVCRTVRVL